MSECSPVAVTHKRRPTAAPALAPARVVVLSNKRAKPATRSATLHFTIAYWNVSTRDSFLVFSLRRHGLCTAMFCCQCLSVPRLISCCVLLSHHSLCAEITIRHVTCPLRYTRMTLTCPPHQRWSLPVSARSNTSASSRSLLYDVFSINALYSRASKRALSVFRVCDMCR